MSLTRALGNQPNRPHQMRHRVGAAVLTALMTLGLLSIPALISPAAACACGAFVPADAHSAEVPAETALLTWADGREDLWLSLSVRSDSAKGALLFPVPDPKTKVSAGPSTLFDELQAVTDAAATSTKRGGDGAGAGAPPGSVKVESRKQIGPLDVAVLTPTDAAALQTWLTGNGFQSRPALNPYLSSYVADHYSFVAAKLRSDVASSTLTGRLDPIRLSFATDTAIYPERLTQAATKAVDLTVYTLSRGSVTVEGTPTLGRQVSAAMPLRTGAALTALHKEFPDRSTITKFQTEIVPGAKIVDYTLQEHVRAGDGPARPGATHQDKSDDAIPTWVWSVLAAVLLAVVIGGFTLHHRGRRSASR